ncbi:MAG: hypothetical protein ACRD0H_11645, partial [Actinomycetes bacterium]
MTLLEEPPIELAPRVVSVAPDGPAVVTGPDHDPLLLTHPRPARYPWPAPPPAQHAPWAPHRRARRDRGLAADPDCGAYTPSVALRGITGHITRTRDGVMAWYRLRARPWSMRPDADREALMA